MKFLLIFILVSALIARASEAQTLSIYSTLSDPEQANRVIELLRCLSDESPLTWELVDNNKAPKPLLEVRSENQEIQTQLNLKDKTETKKLAATDFATYYCHYLPQVLNETNKPLDLMPQVTDHAGLDSTFEPQASKSFWKEHWLALSLIGFAAGAFIYIRSQDPQVKGIVVQP